MGVQTHEPGTRQELNNAFRNLDVGLIAGDGVPGSASPSEPPSRLKVMIVGDSMTHGSQGDYTWRYRIWEWFRGSGTEVEFVGPWLGTQEPDQPSPPKPPPLPTDPPPPEGPRTAGGYAKDASKHFDSHHFSCWGYAAAQARDAIRERVETYKPDTILTMLGFNDMGWFISDANGTLESMQIFVENARAANPGVRFALGNVPQRTHMEGRQDLVENTTKYNDMLKHAIPQWSTAESPIALVDIAKHYICETGAYDGLHPNALGDYQIARAFSDTLHRDFGIGPGPSTIPSDIPKRDLPAPSNLSAEGAPMGVKVTWEQVYGAMFYDVRHRQKGDAHWKDSRILSNRYDTVYPSPGEHWEYQVRSGYADYSGEWSHTVHAISKEETAPAPRNVKVLPTSVGFDISWTPPEGDWDIDRYEIIWHDVDLPGAFFGGVSARGTSHAVTELIPDHRHSVWMCTWTKQGGGRWKSMRPVFVDHNAPEPPKKIEATIASKHHVRLSWTASENAAGYVTYVRRIGEPGSQRVEDGVRKETDRDVGSLSPRAEDFEFCVTAVNGELESECVDWNTAKPSS